MVAGTQAKTKSVYTGQFVLLCLSSFLFFASFNMIIPELPGHLENLGGGEYKGFIIALFTVTAGLSRPFSGKLADRIGRLPVMVVGGTVCFVCGLFYPFVLTVSGFLTLRLLHGFSTGFQPTGTSAYVADIVPDGRRGEATGILGFVSNMGTASGPALGGWLAQAFSADAMFYTSSASGLLSVLVLARMKESLPAPERFRLRLLKIPLAEILEPRVFFPSLVLMLSVFCFGTVLTLAPDFSDWLGVGNKGLFFTVFTLASLTVRIVAGRASDIHGRQVVLTVAVAVLVVSMAVIGWAGNVFVFMGGAALFGLAVGMTSPTITAWTIDLSHSAYRGRAMATMFIALETGIGTGALAAGWIYGNDPARFPLAFGLAGIMALAALVLLLLKKPAANRPLS